MDEPPLTFQYGFCMWFVRGAAAIFGVVLLAGCGTERLPKQVSDVTATPTTRPLVTHTQMTVDAQSLPGCTQGSEAQVDPRHFSRSFDCDSGDRLTLDIVLYSSAAEAESSVDNQWGTMDGARENIREVVRARPVSQSSLAVANATPTFGKVGAEQENIYCATYTDPSGAVTYTQYFGALRHKHVVVQYTSWAQSGGACEGASRARESARYLAVQQLAKLRAVLP